MADTTIALKEYLEENRPFAWKKKGRIFSPNDDEYTHGSHPCAIHYKDDTYVIAFTRRNSERRSNVFLSYATIADGCIELVGEPKLAMKPGPVGHFDCDGAISVSLIKSENTIYLYYVGWQNLPESLWICDTGRAILDPDNLTLEREFPGPVLGRDKDNPLFAAATAFYIKDGKWQTWYNSGVAWEKREHGWHHRYGIHYAESSNGVDWICEKGMCIPFADDNEYAFGRPSVYVEDGTYYMWYAHRATKNAETYRIGFSYSNDGKVWQRADNNSGIDVSASSWDSQMICYPYVFRHNGYMYMLYNGNNYGETGFGYASMEVM